MLFLMAPVAHAKYVVDCNSPDIIAFNEQAGTGQGKDYEFWKCPDGWEFSANENERAYVKRGKNPDENQACLKNSTTGQDLFCCPENPGMSNDSTAINAKYVENAKKSTRIGCVPEPGSQDPNAKKTYLSIESSDSPKGFLLSGSAPGRQQAGQSGPRVASFDFRLKDSSGGQQIDPAKQGSVRLDLDLGKGSNDCSKRPSDGSQSVAIKECRQGSIAGGETVLDPQATDPKCKNAVCRSSNTGPNQDYTPVTDNPAGTTANSALR
jgi:hypothetical protein